MTYTDPETVRDYMGRPALTSVQTSLLEDFFLDAADEYVNTAVGRDLSTTAITGERYPMTGPLIWLHRVPIASVQGVVLVTDLSRGLSIQSETLVADTGYQILSLDRGMLMIAGSFYPRFTFALVDYTPAFVPLNLAKMAATILCAFWLRVNLDPSRLFVRQYDVGRELRVDMTGTDVIPAEVVDLLDTIQAEVNRQFFVV
jgi:hypothetical protein